MVKIRKCLRMVGIALVWCASVAIMQIPFHLWIQHRQNPLRDFGVSIEMFFPHDAATSSMPWIHVYCDYSRNHITPEIVWGGIPHPSLQFEDVDKDGIKDIVFGNEQCKQIVAFKPASHGNSPRFVVLRNDVK